MNKIFCGNGRVVNSWKRGISVCVDDIPKEYVTTSKNGKRYIRLNVVDLKQKNQWGKDVSVEVDTWKPGQNNDPVVERVKKAFGPESFEGDIPF